MSVSANAIVALDLVKERLKENKADNDAVIERMIDTFTRLIELEIRGPVKQRTITDYRFSGNGGASMRLPRSITPLISITKIEIRNNTTDVVEESLTAASDWIIKDLDTGLIRLTDKTFTLGVNNVLLTGSVGYSTADERYRPFEDACYIAIEDYYRRWGLRELGVVTKTYSDGSVSLIPAASLPPICKQMLAAARPHRPMVR